MASAARTEFVLRLVCDIYASHGRKISLPQNTDPSKTYHWRYAAALADRLGELELDEGATRKFLEIVVEYAKSKGLMAKGLSFLCQANLLEICHRRLTQERERACSAADEVRDNHEFVMAAAGRLEPAAVMLRKPRPGSYCNLVDWYVARSVGRLYLSLSRSAAAAMKQLAESKPAERSMLPSPTELYTTRTAFLADSANYEAVADILGGDCKKCRT